MRYQHRLCKLEAATREVLTEPAPISEELYLNVLVGKASPHTARPYFQHIRRLPPGVEEGLYQKLTAPMWEAREI